MDPVTIIGLAASAVSVVDFSIKIISKYQALRKSADRAIAENEEILQAHQYLPELLNSLSGSIQNVGAIGPRTLAEQALLDASNQCLETASELRKILNELRLSNAASKLQRLSKAMKAVSINNRLKQLQDKLERFQIALDTQILVDLRRKFDAGLVKQSETYQHWNLRFQHIANALIEQKSAFTGAFVTISQFQQQLKEHVSTEHEKTRNHITKEILKLQINDHQELASSLLKSLHFPEINARREAIHGIHKDTYQWIFEEGRPAEAAHRDWHDFVQWLKSGDTIYWIQGKAGSGKSTMMNYICDDPRTAQALACWPSSNGPEQQRLAGIKEGATSSTSVLTPTFFFWNSGSMLQKSIPGMLRALMYQLISARPHLATSLSKFSIDFTTVWTEKKLRDGLEAILKLDDRKENICFFIDGLDEFHGESEDLVFLIKSITSLKGVKACVSSRPWNVFRSSFETQPQLRLELFTYNDIAKFVREKLGDGINSIRGTTDIQSAEFSNLVHSLCTKANGVFLWTRLAVASLLRGKVNQDSLEIMKERMNALPPELQDMYQHMLDCVEPIYRDWTNRLLYCASQVYELPPPHFEDFTAVSVSILQLYLMMQPKAALVQSDQDFSRFFEGNWYERVRSLVNSACLGLVEIEASPLLWNDSLQKESYQTGGDRNLTNFLRWQSPLRCSHQTVVAFVRDESRGITSPENRRKWNREIVVTAFKSMLCLLRAHKMKILPTSPNVHVTIDRALNLYALPALSTSDRTEAFEDPETTGLIRVFEHMLSDWTRDVSLAFQTCRIAEKKTQRSKRSKRRNKQSNMNADTDGLNGKDQADHDADNESCTSDTSRLLGDILVSLAPNCLALAAKNDITSYLMYRLQTGQIPKYIYNVDSCTYLLQIVIRRVLKASVMMNGPFSLTRQLLAGGADPNRPGLFIKKCSWQVYLTFLTNIWQPWRIASPKAPDIVKIQPGEREMMLSIITYFMINGASMKTTIMLDWISWRRMNLDDGGGDEIQFHACNIISIEMSAWMILHRIAEADPSLAVLDDLIGPRPETSLRIRRSTYYLKINHNMAMNDPFAEAWTTSDAGILRELEQHMIQETSHTSWLETSKQFQFKVEKLVAESKTNNNSKTSLTCYNPVGPQLLAEPNFEEEDRRRCLALIERSINGEDDNEPRSVLDSLESWIHPTSQFTSTIMLTAPQYEFLNGFKFPENIYYESKKGRWLGPDVIVMVDEDDAEADGTDVS